MGFFDVALVGVFLAVIVLPTLGAFLGPKTALSTSEKRELAEPPRLGLSPSVLTAFPGGAEAYFNDHFGFRRELIKAFNYFQVEWLKRSPVEKVILGKHHWLFYTGDHVIEDHRGLRPFTQEELEKARLVLENRRDELAARGIRYLFVVVPNKHTIYPEYLPDYVTKAGISTRFDQLKAYLDARSDFDLMDLRGVLKEAKEKQLLYRASDTHWNEKGLFLGYSEMMKRIAYWFPDVKPLETSQLAENTALLPGGDLANMLDLTGVFREPYTFLRLPKPCAGQIPSIVDLTDIRKRLEAISPDLAPYSDGCSTARLHGLVFHDSFFAMMRIFLSEHFGRVAYIWSLYDKDLIERFAAASRLDIVVDERIERAFGEALALNEQSLEGLLKRRFEWLPETLFCYAGGELKDLQTYGGVFPSSTPGGLALDCQGSDPQLFLPPFELPAGRGSVMRIVLTSPEDTLLQVFFTTREHPSYSEAQSVIRPIRKGLNEVFVEIPKGGVTGRLRLDPGAAPGVYLLHGIVVHGRLKQAS